MAIFKKVGINKLRVCSIVTISLAIVIQIAAVSSPKWSEIDVEFLTLPIHAYQNLWTETVVEDKVNAYPQPKNMDVAWKKDIQVIEVTSIVVGAVALLLLLATSFLVVVRDRPVLAGLFLGASIIVTVVASIQIIVGALLYNYQKTTMFSYIARNPASHYPLDKEKATYGFILSVFSSFLFSASAVVEIIQLIFITNKKQNGAVVPFEKTSTMATNNDETPPTMAKNNNE